MAYANLLNQSCTDKNELFCRVRDFICKRNGTYDYSSTGIGWTLHDSSYATDEDNTTLNDWFVVYSPGEGGEDDMYIQIVYLTNFIRFRFYQSWDNSTHAGANGTAAQSTWTMADADAKTLWVYGDLDEVFCVSKLSTTDYRIASFGKLEKGWDNQSKTIASCSSALSSGSDVSITVDAVPSNWVVGKEIYIRTTHNDDTSTVKMEKIEIKTLASNTITADLTNSYTANSALSDFVGYYVTGGINWSSSGYALIAENGTIGTATGGFTFLPLSEARFDPGDYEDRWFLIEYFLHGALGLMGKSNHIRRTPTINSPLVVEDIIEEDDGTEWRVFHCYSNNYVAIKEV